MIGNGVLDNRDAHHPPLSLRYSSQGIPGAGVLARVWLAIHGGHLHQDLHIIPS